MRMTFYCKCNEKTITCQEGRCSTFSIEGILDDIESIDFGVLGTWDNNILDSLAKELYQTRFKTIDEFYYEFDYFIRNDDDSLRRKVLIDKFDYIQAKMTEILKQRIGYSEKDEAVIKIQNLEYKIDFKKRRISHTVENGLEARYYIDDHSRYYINYGAQVNDIEYLFSNDPMIYIGNGVRTNVIHIYRQYISAPICSFYLNQRYIDDE